MRDKVTRCDTLCSTGRKVHCLGKKIPPKANDKCGCRAEIRRPPILLQRLVVYKGTA